MKQVIWGIYDIFSTIERMIWPITVVVMVVIIARLFMKRISKQACFCLWLVVAIRLVCPVTISSEFSIFNVIKEPAFTITTGKESAFLESLYVKEETISDINIGKSTVNESMQEFEVGGNTAENHLTTYESNTNPNVLNQSFPSQEKPGGIGNASESTINSDTIYTPHTNNGLDTSWIWCFIWFLGLTLMLLYGLITYCNLRHKLRFATKADDNYFESDTISSPFVFGIVKPVIYLPCHLKEQEKHYILMHEQYHIRRRDYLIKLFAFGLLSVYWFHPFVWIAFYLMSQDMEMSCDEQVLKELQTDDRKAYSTLLLSFASGKRFPLPSPLSFGENNVKSRIKQILNYKKPTVLALAFVFIIILVVAICCLTDAGDDSYDLDDTNITGELPTENKIHPETGKLTDEYLNILSEKLYDAKNPYIGDVSANGKILRYLKETLDIQNTNGTELQTTQSPYWITLGFTERPETEEMIYLATMFLSLVDNASEFRWEYTDPSTGEILVCYLNERLVNHYLTEELQIEKGIKEYAESPETIAELWRLLDKICVGNDASDFYRYRLIGESNWKNIANELGFDFTEANKWENQFIESGILYDEDEEDLLTIRNISSCIYKDFDENGQKDMAVLVSGYFGVDYGSRLYFYMNGEKDYYETDVMDMCYWIDVHTGDIDHDGYLEFVYIGNTGGNGGAGSWYKNILKYKNHTFEQMPLPGDLSNDEWNPGEMGFELSVAWGKEMDTYDIYCPALNVTKNVYSPYPRDSEGNLFQRPYPGQIVGGNCRGFHTLEIIEKDGKDYLIGTEVVMGEGGTVHCFANARFVFDWDKDKGWVVTDYDILGDAYRDDIIWSMMQTSLEHLPSTKEEIIERNIPLIDYKSNQIIDPYNQLSSFTLNRKDYNFDVTLTYATINADNEIIYSQVVLKNGQYYYLEDYTRLKQKTEYFSNYKSAVYSNALYEVRKNQKGEYVEYFYLTNDANLTIEIIQNAMLSSTEPSNYDVVQIYHKALDETGLGNYMRATGDIIDLGIQVLLPENYEWIQSPNYYVLKEDSFNRTLAKVEYYDGIIFTDMTLLIGEREDVMSQTDITVYMERFTPENWSAATLNDMHISIDFYVMPIDDIYKMTAAIWEYDGNIYLLYGKTAAGDCSPVAKTAVYIIKQFH